MVLERVDLNIAMKYVELKEKIIQERKIPGALFTTHSSHFPGVAVHTNQYADKSHTDRWSSHLGYDGISSFGDFKGLWYLFPTLGIRIRIHPGDIVLLRGAALPHQAWGWRGRNRLVLVPFADRQLFSTERVGRIRECGRLYGANHKHVRGNNPAKKLDTFEQ
jgi:hypothetical protein